MEFDRNLGPYALEHFGEWKQISNYISKHTIDRLGIMKELLSFLKCFFTLSDSSVPQGILAFTIFNAPA